MAKWDSKTVTDAVEDSGKAGAPGGGGVGLGICVQEYSVGWVSLRK